MTRPFTPRDTLRLRSQQHCGTALELEAVVLLGQSPLRQAMAGLWPFGDGVDTLLEDGVNGGFVQARRRLGGTEADLTFIAPSLASANGAALAWQRLLSGVCQWLGARGVQRIYAAIDEDDRVALQIFRQLGFVVHTSDTVLRRPAEPGPEEVADIKVAQATEVSEAAISRLLTRCWPSVQAREGSPEGDWCRYPLGGRAPGAVISQAWLDERGAVIGAWRAVAGRSGHWLRIAVDDHVDAGPAVRQALADIANHEGFEPRPVYCAARGYETALNLALRDYGFEPVKGRFRLVKHTTARILEPAWRRRSLAEHGLDPAPTHSASRPSLSHPGS